MRFSLLKLVKFLFFFLLFATGFITPVNKDYHYSYILQIIYVTGISDENKLLPPYPPHLKNVTTLHCKMLNFFIWLKVMLRSSKRWWLRKEPVVGWHWWLWKEPVVICGNWNVMQTTSQQVFKVATSCTDTCFQPFRHWSTASSTMLC